MYLGKINNMSINYNTDNLIIEYHNNIEYRNILRSLFNMKSIPTHNISSTYPPHDEEYLYDLSVDDDKLITEAYAIYEITKNNIIFQELYDLAAAKMFSLDRTIGNCVLFSYDYLYLFHACLCVFLNNEVNFTKSCKYYIQLKIELEKR